MSVVSVDIPYIEAGRTEERWKCVLFVGLHEASKKKKFGEG
jgi:hypothetical protein